MTRKLGLTLNITGLILIGLGILLLFYRASNPYMPKTFKIGSVNFGIVTLIIFGAIISITGILITIITWKRKY